MTQTNITYESALTGGHRNSLGNTVAVVEDVLAQPSNFEELFNCYFSNNEVVRLRTSNAIMRLAKTQRSLLIPYLDRFLTDVTVINQASTQWTLAQLFLLYHEELNPKQREQAKVYLCQLVEEREDWIVLVRSMQALGLWAKEDSELAHSLKPHALRHANDQRKTVAKAARALLRTLETIE